MNEYEIGRDYQELRSRIERLEESMGGPPGSNPRGIGTAACHHQTAGVDHHEPMLWKPDEKLHLPPLVKSILGLPVRGMYDSAQSKSWGCQPDPLILSVTWNAGGTDEFYRLTNQLFSILRFTDPNTGKTTASATYSANLVASGKAGSVWNSPPLFFTLTLRDQAAPLDAFSGSAYWVSCHDNHPFIYTWEFQPALFDLVTGATWLIQGTQTVNRC